MGFVYEVKHSTSGVVQPVPPGCLEMEVGPLEILCLLDHVTCCVTGTVVKLSPFPLSECVSSPCGFSSPVVWLYVP